MSNDEAFQEALRLGIIAEEIVYEYLKNNNSFVQDMRKQTHEDNRGPRLIGTDGELVLPDFGVSNKDPSKGHYLIDAKYKSSVYTIKGVKYFTVDRKYEQYKRVKDVLRYDFLKMAFLFEDRMYIYHENECTGTHQFKPNSYGDGLVYLFQFNGKKPTY